MGFGADVKSVISDVDPTVLTAFAMPEIMDQTSQRHPHGSQEQGDSEKHDEDGQDELGQFQLRAMIIFFPSGFNCIMF